MKPTKTKTETHKIRINGKFLDTEYDTWIGARIDIDALKERNFIKVSDVVEIVSIEITYIIDRIGDDNQ